MWWLKFFIISILYFCVLAKDYQGYKVYGILSKTNEQKNFLFNLHKTNEFDVWSLPRSLNRTTNVMVAPNQQEIFEKLLKTNKFVFNIVNNDVSTSIRQEQKGMQQIKQRNNSSRTIDFESFHRFDDINKYLDELVAKLPDKVSIFKTGKSYEGRDLKVIKITNGDKKENKSVIFVDAGIHAREWVAPAGALYVIDQLTNNFDKNKHLLQDYDWIILPVINPDGYEYSHEYNRYWRKTRQPFGKCFGTDGNRNFNFHWAETGTQIDICSDIFHGTVPFSEPETALVRDILHSLEGQCKMYLTIHSFGKYLLYPWGWTSNLPDTWKDLDEVAQAAFEAIKAKNGEVYTVGTSTNVLYSASGGSDDYAFAKAKIPIAITIEMNGEDFVVPNNLIKQYAEECWVGIKAMAEKVIEKYTKN